MHAPFTIWRMGRKDARVDAYIAQSAVFAQPILRSVRRLVHQACPDVEETIKWSCPHFDYHGIMLGMAAFKEHCAIGFWKGELVLGEADGSDGGMGHFGRVTSLADLPSDEQFVAYVRAAAQLNRDGVKRPNLMVRRKQPRVPLSIPDYFKAALRKNKEAATTFRGFTPEPVKNSDRMAGRGKTAQLEVHAELILAAFL